MSRVTSDSLAKVDRGKVARLLSAVVLQRELPVVRCRFESCPRRQAHVAQLEERWCEDPADELTRPHVVKYSTHRMGSSKCFLSYHFALESKHRKDCCEQHYLSFGDLSLEDFEGLEFDLSEDTFFRRVPGYGIELIPVSGWGVKIPGYSSNNGYYSTNLTLVLRHPVRGTVKWDITECQ